jgi:hypothetical protein
MKSHVLTGLALPCALILAAGAPMIFADDHDKKTDVTITEPVEVPGGVVLQPGTYMFRLMEITANRHVVQIRSEDGKKTYAIAMVAAAHRTEPTSKVVLTFWEMPSGQPAAVRKWFWPGDVDGQEFMYSHKRAAEISKLSKETVPEASDEDLTAANNSTATDDTAASNNTATANAAPEQSSTTTAAATPAPAPSPAPETSVTQTTVTETTTAAVPAPTPDQPTQTQPTQTQSELLAQATPPAPPAQNPPLNSDSTSLPQTASDLPLIALVGGLSLAAAVTMRRLRA